MADYIKGLFGGASPATAPSVVPADADFADFASAPEPTPASLSITASGPASQQTFGPSVPFSERPYTKWYNVQERVSLADFYAELFILPVLLVLVAMHVWGTRANRSKARAWITAHAPALTSEFAVVGFGGEQSSGPEVIPEQLLKEKSKDVFLSYATGRQNIAFTDIKLNLYKRYNPLALFGDSILGFFFESMPVPSEKAEITIYPFDGREADIVPRVAGQEADRKGRGSSYDGFIWAIVHKDLMKHLRDQRYDLSLTITKEHAKLPAWATVMSESAEINDTLLTPDLIKAVEACGDDFESLVVTDMPEDAPKTLDDLLPKKRLSLKVRLTDSGTTVPVLSSFLRLPDLLVSSGRFRPEVMRRVKATRDEETKKIRKLDEQEKAEGRKTETDKAKKEERERKLKGMSADEQRKYLDKERERDSRRAMGRKTVKA